MDDFLTAPMPRSLRVRATLQVANTRLPARSFVLLMALLLMGGVAVARGADLVGTARMLGAAAALGVALLEGRWWGYTTPALVALLLAHLTRAGTLDLDQPLVTLRPELGPAQPDRRPQWQ